MAQIVDGRQFGRFQIHSRLGRGGMASVYRAYEHSLDRTVALKVMPEELLDQPGFVERFEREARVIAKLEHPHIVPLYASGIDEGHPWMALRLVRGGHLGERMENGALERDAGLDYLVKIADALDFAHSQGVVHRDIKPQNILVGERGECYIADYGIASLLEGTTKLTQTGAALGTPQYMAPEQAKGETVGPAADIYALGIIVYQWQTGLLPFDADTPYAVMFKHVSAPLPMQPLSHLCERAQQVIARALAKTPGDRWPTASAFVQELRACLAEPATAAPAAVIPRAMTPNPEIAAAGAKVVQKASGQGARVAPPASRATGTPAPADAPRADRGKVLGALAALVLVVGGIWGFVEWRETQRQAEGARLALPSGAENRFSVVDDSVKDAQTGLIWDQADNGREIGWEDAKGWCAGRGGRLPSVAELQGIYDETGSLSNPCDADTFCKTSPLFRLTSYAFWSSEPNGSSEAWLVYLLDGTRDAYAVDLDYSQRALCVRRS